MQRVLLKRNITDREGGRDYPAGVYAVSGEHRPEYGSGKINAAAAERAVIAGVAVDADELEKLNRETLEDVARGSGVENPEEAKNKEELEKEIRKQERQQRSRQTEDAGTKPPSATPAG